MIRVTTGQSNYFRFGAYRDGNEAGRAFLFIIYNELHSAPYGLLEDVFVKEEFRKKGIGKELVQQVIAAASKNGCYKVVATSRDSRESVHRLYEHLGFQKNGYEFRFVFPA